MRNYYRFTRGKSGKNKDEGIVLIAEPEAIRRARQEAIRKVIQKAIIGAKINMSSGDYMLAPHHRGRNFKSGVFTEKPLPDGRKVKVLNRKVFDGAVKAAMDVKKAHD